MSRQLMIAEVLGQPQAVSWLPWAVQYFFFIGIAACAALLACVWRWRGGDNAAHLERMALFIGLTCAITAPLALTADLHQTARFWHFYAYPTPWSWMPWGALFLPLFTLLIGLWFLALEFARLTGRPVALLRGIAPACALVAIGLLLYTGREVSVVRARPIWFSYGFPIVMFLSALQALLALLLLTLRERPGLQAPLARGMLLTLLLLGGAILLWVCGDTLSGAAVRHWLQTQAMARRYAVGWIALWGLTLACAAWAGSRRLPCGGTTLLVAGALGLSWLMRWTLLIEVQTIPKYNATYSPYSLPLGTDGLLAIVGTFGLWLALMIMVREAQAFLLRRKQHG
ncbi:TPA: tetrathionate reductase subunit TtrC [Serratia marcescens]|nr:tetrathionate reductase subunit TtrC [Serratia marcescens]